MVARKTIGSHFIAMFGAALVDTCIPSPTSTPFTALMPISAPARSASSRKIPVRPNPRELAGDHRYFCTNGIAILRTSSISAAMSSVWTDRRKTGCRPRCSCRAEAEAADTDK